MAPVCRYYLNGECRYGDRCKYEHPRNLPRNENRFAASQGNKDGGRPISSQAPPFSLNKEIIIADLSNERPQWILSAYGPGSKAPAQLFGGPIREQSFEEMRLHHYNAVVSGNLEQAIKEANALVQEADSQMRNALSNIDAAIEFIYNAENEHPNRNDICQASVSGSTSTEISSNRLLSSSTLTNPQASSGFGQPSTLGVKPNLFAASQQAFGQPSVPGSAGTFGQPSALGQKSNPFGSQSAGIGLMQGAGNSIRPFSTFAAKSNPFGAPSQPAAADTFSQNAASNERSFAQSEPNQNPFGQPKTQSELSSFGSNMTSSPFGAPSQTVTKNPFGSTSQSGHGGSFMDVSNQPLPSNPFGQSNLTSVSPSLFSQSAKVSSNLFDQRSSSLTSPQSNPFAASKLTVQAQANGTEASSPYGTGAEYKHPALQSYVSKDGNQRLKMFKGSPVEYKENEPGIHKRDGTWEKIWFPDGPPTYYGATELDNNAYTEDIKQAYLYVREKGVFKDGIIPVEPPKREWCLWDF